MQYELTQLLLSNQDSVVITEDQFNEIKTARRCLVEALAAEEKFDLLRANYHDLEQHFLELSLNYEMYDDRDWSVAVSEVTSINRYLVNLLSTWRMYVDHMPQQLNAIFGEKSEEANTFQAATCKEFDDHLGYRVCYALRNYVQHSGWPVHLVTHSNQWIELGSGKCRRSTTTAFIKTEYLVGTKFRKQTLDELLEIGSKIEIKPLVRENMGAFGRLHTLIRQLLQSYLLKWDSVVTTAVETYTSQFDGKTLGLAIVASDDETVVESHTVFIDLIKRRKYLEKRNQQLKVYTNSYISSEAMLGLNPPNP